MANYWKQRELAAVVESRGLDVIVPGYPEWTFRVRRLCDWNMDYQRALARVSMLPTFAALVAKLRADPNYAANMSEADRDADESMTSIAFADGCLAEWEGVTDCDGKPLSFSAAAAADLLMHFPDIRAHLIKAASDPANFQPMPEAEKAKRARGNSKPA